MTEILAQLEINNTFFYQFGMFCAFFFILSGLYLKPFQKLIENRNHKLKAEVSGATDLLKSVESKLVEYERELQTTRTEARMIFEKNINEVRAREEAMISEQREKLKKEFQTLSQQLNEQKKQAEIELKNQATTLADGVVDRLLSGR